jgi:hypothetical protein
VATALPDTVPFILPVVIDDLPHDHASIPERFRKVHWEPQKGAVSPGFVDRVKGLYREYQSRTVVRA